MQDGMADLKLDGVWVQAKVGDLVRLPRGIPHGYFNKSNKPAKAFFWVSPNGKLEALFERIHGLIPTRGVADSSGFPNHLRNDSRWQTEGRLPWARRLR